MGGGGDASDRQSRDRRRARQDAALWRSRDDWRDRSGAARLRSLGEDVAERARADPAPLVRSHHRQSRRHRPHHDQRTGQAARGSARRGRLRRGLYRVFRRGGEAHLWRGQSDLPRRFPHRRHQAADRRRGCDHAVEFSRGDDHPQGRAGDRRRLHRGGEARGRDAVDRACARRTWLTRRPAARRSQFCHRRSARHRQGDDRASGRAGRLASPARPRSARS